jgi:hypothetical protein
MRTSELVARLVAVIALHGDRELYLVEGNSDGIEMYANPQVYRPADADFLFLSHSGLRGAYEHPDDREEPTRARV